MPVKSPVTSLVPKTVECISVPADVKAAVDDLFDRLAQKWGGIPLAAACVNWVKTEVDRVLTVSG